jgi:polysaccharide biosynthesis/export protein
MIHAIQLQKRRATSCDGRGVFGKCKEFEEVFLMRKSNASFNQPTLRHTFVFRLFQLSLSVVLLAATVCVGFSQQPAATVAATPVATPAATPSASPVASPAATPVDVAVKHADERYLIGTGDVLDIRVFNKPQFSRDGVRVDGSGMIRMPLIEGEIRATCRTEQDLAREITERYKEYLRNPQVDVFVKEYQSQPVAVLGAVRTPSRFQLQRRVRLLEILSFVGGPADSAGRSIQVVHTTLPDSNCSTKPAQSVPEEVASVDYYRLDATLKGEDQSNPFLRAGDIVSIAEADQVFIVGNVLKPSALPLKEQITVSRAIAMVGGTMPDTKSNRVRIVRQTPGTTAKTEIYVDLKAIEKRQAEDPVLQANDIVDVPTSEGKRFLRSIVGAFAPSVAQLPVRVVP